MGFDTRQQWTWVFHPLRRVLDLLRHVFWLVPIPRPLQKILMNNTSKEE
jgi:hypothetical protein